MFPYKSSTYFLNVLLPHLIFSKSYNLVPDFYYVCFVFPPDFVLASIFYTLQCFYWNTWPRLLLFSSLKQVHHKFLALPPVCSFLSVVCDIKYTMSLAWRLTNLSMEFCGRPLISWAHFFFYFGSFALSYLLSGRFTCATLFLAKT
jgi:hypothetical protein